MKTFEEALDDIYDRAKARQIAERRRNKRLITLATTCATLSVVVVLSVVFVWGPADDNKGTETESIYSLSGKLSIYQIPGAKVVKNTEYAIVAGSKGSSPVKPEIYAERLRTSFPTVIGEVLNMRCVTIEDDIVTWSITSFDIKISEAVTFPIESEIITCVTACQYINGDPQFNSKCGLSNVAYDISQNPDGFYVLKTSPTDDWVINGEVFDFSKYADYYVVRRYDYEEDGFMFYGSKIKFDDIRYK